jgi:glucitol/sorbitol PTS system EIIA component
MAIIVEAKVSGIGEMVEQLLQDQALILFDDTAPKELHDVAVLLSKKKLNGDIQAGDQFVIDGYPFEIYFVGAKANQSMRDLGHVTLKFDGRREDLPGSICMETKEMPLIAPGSLIQIIRD